MKTPVDWIEQALIEPITLQQEEHLQLDFNRADSLDSQEKKRTEISKDASAFANSTGGTIVYGIAESAQEPHCAESFSPSQEEVTANVLRVKLPIATAGLHKLRQPAGVQLFLDCF